mmetsp:Transcript_24074/g.45438  ORF Transcript_24074/g.45438 Transcript_24074/m.45438 type:complete len:182 (+) Transcript_24074:51-596(+)
MSSIYQAVASDLRGNRPSRGNPIVQNDRSFRDDGNINEDIERQRKQEADMRKQLRMEEGGRAGGYNDRQQTATKEHRAAEAEDGYDDFGRRVSNRAGDKKQRAQAALDRLRGAKAKEEEPPPERKPSPRRAETKPSRRSPARRSRSRRSRSRRSRSRSRSRSDSSDRSRRRGRRRRRRSRS